ncbi:aspartate/glutamate racemase family protein [Mitsuokella sp.]|uniref:aspartate/glutamate racemase family protein n=1 Tax=Mitsuokella sp. TaxID=2049034 RepID=UPI003D7CE4E1
MKVAVVYTSTTPELIADLEAALKKVLPADVEIASYQDPSILAEVREHGYVTAAPAARLITMYMKAVSEGADAILNVCSSVGEVADAAQDIAKYTGIPIVRIDEEMCREAVRLGLRIGVMATLQTTLEPTKNTIRRVAREMNKHVTLVDALVEGGFGLNPDQFKQLMTDYAGKINNDVDVILFAQGSMAYCEEYIHQKYNKPVLSSVRFGAQALRQALVAKGLIKE